MLLEVIHFPWSPTHNVDLPNTALKSLSFYAEHRDINRTIRVSFQKETFAVPEKNSILNWYNRKCALEGSVAFAF